MYLSTQQSCDDACITSFIPLCDEDKGSVCVCVCVCGYNPQCDHSPYECICREWVMKRDSLSENPGGGGGDNTEHFSVTHCTYY